MSDLERRAEELIDAPLFNFPSTQGSEGVRLIDWIGEARRTLRELLSALVTATAIKSNWQVANDELQSTIAQQKEDLDRISAEREALQDTARKVEENVSLLQEMLAATDNTPGDLASLWTGLFNWNDMLRRILAENDR